MASMNINTGIKGFKHGSTMQDVQVPDQLRKRIPTKLKFFDEVLGGEGFVPSNVVMLTGAPGAGKTTLLLQLTDALQEQGNVVLYNTGEESLYQIKLVCERLKLKGNFFIGQDQMVSDVIDHARMLQKKFPKKQVIIIQDSLQTLDDGKYANGTTGNTPVTCCEMLASWSKETYGITIFIGQVNKDGKFAGKNTIKHAVDAHVELMFDDEKRSETYGERLMSCSKNRFGSSGKVIIVGMEKTGLYMKDSI